MAPPAITVTWPVAAAVECAVLDARVAAVIRVDAVWLAVEPLDMRAGTESALARVVNVFGAPARTTPTCSPTGAPTA